MAEILIGAAAINRNSYYGSGFTRHDGGYNADGDGIIDTVEVWAYLSSMQNTRVGTLYHTGGVYWKCRDSEDIGLVYRGSKQTFSNLSIDVITGDHLATYYTAGNIEMSSSGYGGTYYRDEDLLDPGDEGPYSSFGGRAISLHGIGETPPVIGPFPTHFRAT